MTTVSVQQPDLEPDSLILVDDFRTTVIGINPNLAEDIIKALQGYLDSFVRISLVSEHERALRERDAARGRVFATGKALEDFDRAHGR